MDDRLVGLKKNMSELVDAELLRIVEVDYADYRQDALDCAKRELASRGIPFNEAVTENQPAESEQEITAHRELVTVATFSAPYEAQLAKGLLETNGIQAFVADEYTVGINWLYSNAVGGVRLQVAETEAEQAMKFLAREGETNNINTERLEKQEKEEGWEACPNCAGRNVEYFTDRKGMALLALVFLGLPLLFPTKKLRCLNCDYVWDYQKGRGTAGWIKVGLVGWLILIAVVVVIAQLFPSLFGDEATEFPPLGP